MLLFFPLIGADVRVGEDLKSLLYEFLEEVLVYFSCEFVIFREVTITSLDLEKHELTFTGYE